MAFKLQLSVFENSSQLAHNRGLGVNVAHFSYFANIIKFYCGLFSIKIVEFH